MTYVEHLSYPRITTGRASVGGEWVATEKIHGGHLVIGYDGRAVQVGKRKAWLRPDEAFFGWQLLRDRFTRAAGAALGRGGRAVRIFGELYGGAHPHPDVPAAPGMAPVQTGVWYSPTVRYALFDVLRHDTPGDPGVFLPYAEVAAVAADAGLDVVPLLARGGRGAVTGDELLDELTLDVMIDLAEAFPAAMGALSTGDEAALQAHIRRTAGDLHAGPVGPPLTDQR